MSPTAALIVAGRTRPAFIAACREGAAGEPERTRMYGIADQRGLRAVLIEDATPRQAGWAGPAYEFGLASPAAAGRTLAGAQFGIIATVINRPVGIRITTSGVSIGGIRHPRRQHAGHHSGDPGALPPATAQRTQVFSCPWPAIRHIEVVTGRGRMKDLARSGRNGRAMTLGTLRAPFITAALVIQADLRHATIPDFRPPDTRRYWFKPSRPGPFSVSPTWYAPTRRPAQLRAALTAASIPQAK